MAFHSPCIIFVNKKAMKHPLFVVVLLSVAAALTVSLQMCANNQSFPKGKFVSYQFCYGGGMNPMDYKVFYLRYEDETGKSLLTVSGKCEGEEITMEVGDEVFEHCLELIKKYNLRRSKGYYEPKFQLLDAPSSSFHICFNDPFDMISGSGDMPQFLWDGISKIHQYFMSIVGDRKAEGHVDRIYGAEGVSGMHWTNGIITVTTPDESVVELERVVRGLAADDDSSVNEMGFGRFRDGDRHFVHIYDYQQKRNCLFYSFDGTDVAREQMVKRDLVSLLFGSYTDSGGKRYVFTSDGLCQGPDDKAPQPFIVFPNKESSVPQYRWGGKTVTGFRLTADGVDILGSSGGKAKVVCHLTRANEGDEIWPVVNQRFLSQPMLDALTLEQLEQMFKSIYVRHNSPFSNMEWYTDIGGVNRDLLSSEMDKRKKE